MKFQIPNSKFQNGFSLIEMIVIISIMVSLSAIITVNFQRQRIQQETHAAASEVISKVREVQNYILSGREVQSGRAASAYEVVFSSGSRNYRVNYCIVSGGSESCSQLETVNLPQKVSLGSSATVRLVAPFGKILIGGSANQVAQIDLRHDSGGPARSVVIDGISGRIGVR